VSIWGSVGGDVTGVDMHGPDADEYAGTGTRRVWVGVAQAAGFGNPGGRLSITEDDDGPVLDVCVMLDRANWRQLRDNIDALLRVLDERLGPE
jgi:hypothetical protein